jgi:hypothetical protein
MKKLTRGFTAISRTESKVLLLLLVTGLAAVAWAGGDPWKTKPASQWTAQDIQAIFQTSPWAKVNISPNTGSASMGMSTMSGPTPGSIPGSSTDTSKTADGALPEQVGGAARERSALTSQSYNIFWWSSRTIQAATARQNVLRGSMTQEAADKVAAQSKDEYEVLVQAANMDAFKRRGEKGMESAASLEMKKSKQKYSPTHVKFQHGADGESVTAVVFYFPKKTSSGDQTIVSDEKEIDFYLMMGGAKILTYFEPKKMADGQGSDL